MRSWLTDRYQFAAVVLIACILAYRCLVLMTSGPNLSMDEAQYWYWSTQLDFGYYSKPPMLAWLIATVTAICGDSEVGVRAASLLIYPAIALILYVFSRRLFNSKTAFYAAAIFFTMPGVAMGNILITTDAPLLLFWCLSLVLFLTVIETNKPWQWLALGVVTGLGLLSKYTMVFFAPSVLLLLLSMRTYRHHLRNPRLYLAAGLALLIFLPNVIWNVRHHYPTLHHTMEISHLDQAWLQWDELAFFLLGQFGVFGFISFAVFLVYAFQLLKNWQETPPHRLIVFALVFLSVITLQALLGSANANWAVPTYIAASILVGYYLAENSRTRWLVAAIILNLSVGSLVYHYESALGIFGIELTRDNDILRDARGWRSLAQEVQKLKANYPAATMLFDSRYEMAEMVYYIRPHPLDAVKWNPRKEIHDHFDLVTTMDGKLGSDFIYVTSSPALAEQMTQSFLLTRKLSDIELRVNKSYKKNFHVFYLHEFRGYTADSPQQAH